MDKRDMLYKNRRILITLALMLLIAVMSLYAMFRVNKVAEESCWNTLYDTAAGLKDKIEKNMHLEYLHLQMVADILAEYDREQTEEMLHVMQTHLHGNAYAIRRMNILFPDDTVLRSDGVHKSVKGELSFAEEAAKGIHISDREYSIVEPGEMVLRNFVPVEKNGETVAMLYGVSVLSDPSMEWAVNAYNGNVAVYIIDTNTGDFIVDTLHDSLGNISAMGDRKMKPGFDSDNLQKNMLQGKNGAVAFMSETAGEYLYFYYMPLAINEWFLGVSVPESLVFARAESIRNTLYQLAVFEAVCFLAYFVWLLGDTQKETRNKQKQLEAVNYVYTVQRILFRAHHDSDAIVSALEQVARVHGAELATFHIISKEETEKLYVWSSDKGLQERVLESYHQKKYVMERFAAKMGNIIVADLEGCHCKETDRERYDHLKELQINNLMEVPVSDANGNLVGILGVFNMKQVPVTTILLEGVSLSFGMIYSNMQLFEKIREMGSMDFLTGIKNRNSYENEMAGYWEEKEGSLACVYADADGLHELNNKQGHEAGDRMLCSIANAFRNAFGIEAVYRTGGDEFVAFGIGLTEAEVRSRMQSIRQQIIADGYHVSVGMQWAAEVKDAAEMDQLIAGAEQEMFREKEKYHKSVGMEERF